MALALAHTFMTGAQYSFIFLILLNRILLIMISGDNTCLYLNLLSFTLIISLETAKWEGDLLLYYVAPGLSLYIIDKIIRWYKSRVDVELVSITRKG